MLISNEIHEGKNVVNDLMQISTSGDLTEKFSKHTCIFGASKTTHYMFQVVRKPISTLLTFF